MSAGTSPPREGKPEVHRAATANVLTVGAALLGGYLAFDVIVRGEGRVVPISLAALALVGALVHALAWRPALVVDDDALSMRNPLKDVRLPWPQVAKVSSHPLTVEAADGRRFQSWAYSDARPRGRRKGRADMRSAELGASEERGAEFSGSGFRAAQLRARRDVRRRAAPDGSVEVRWAWWSIGPVLGCLLAVLVVTALP